MDFLDRILDHDDSANAAVLAACGGLTEEQLDQTFDSGHGTLRATFGHMLMNLDWWSGQIRGELLPYDEKSLALDELINWHRRAQTEFAALARRMREEGRLNETFVDYWKARKSIAGTILHITQHNLEHRTQALHMLKRLGVTELPELDHGLWDYLQLNPQS